MVICVVLEWRRIFARRNRKHARMILEISHHLEKMLSKQEIYKSLKNLRLLRNVENFERSLHMVTDEHRVLHTSGLIIGYRV